MLWLGSLDVRLLPTSFSSLTNPSSHSFQFLKRQEVRAKYNIRGDTVTDALFSCFCGCCSIIQDEKEVIARQAAAGAGGYAKPEGMVAGPQN